MVQSAHAGRRHRGDRVDIHGPIDVGLFRMAVERAFLDAESTRVRNLPDGLQAVVPEIPPLVYLDVSGEPDPITAAGRWLRAECGSARDLTRDMLMSTALFATGPDEFSWFLYVHEFALDEHGIGMFIRRVFTVYDALRSGKAPELPPFGTVEALVAEEDAYRCSSGAEFDRQYWLDHLADCPAPVSLAPRPGQGEHSHRESSHPEMWARHANLTVAVVSTVASHLHQETGATDVVLYLKVSGRVTPLALRTPGQVAGVVPLRLHVPLGSWPADLVGQVTEEIRAALRHQRYEAKDARPGVRVTVLPYGPSLTVGGHRATVHNVATGPVDDFEVLVAGRGRQVVTTANADRYSAEDTHAHHLKILGLLATV